MRNGVKEGKRKIVLKLRGVLFDFGYTLTYHDEENVRRYREKLVSILMKYGYDRTLDDFVTVLESTHRNATKTKMKDIYELWKALLKNLGLH